MKGSEVHGPETDDRPVARDAEIRPPTSEAWAAALRDALLAVLTEEDVDITPGAGDEPGILEVSTDDWTLRVEGLTDPTGLSHDPASSLLPPPSPVTAWVAIDDEPEDPARYRAARRAVMPPALDRALAKADATLEGALRAALEAGGDPFSQDLAEWMRDPGHGPG